MDTENNRWVLVPIFTERESEDEFIAKLKELDKLVLLFVIDQGRLGEVPAAFVGSRIKKAEAVMDEIKQKLPETLTINDYVEWGNWIEKLENISRLEKVSKVLMIECELTERFRPLLKTKNIEFEVFRFED